MTAFCRALTKITEIHVKSRSLPLLQEVAGSKTCKFHIFSRGSLFCADLAVSVPLCCHDCFVVNWPGTRQDQVVP